mgnify:CR=1 FL=1
MTPKQVITIASTSLIIIGGILGVTWTDPIQFFVAIGMIVFGIVLFLLCSTFSIAKWADELVSGNKTEISFSFDPEQDVKSDEKNKGK